MRKAYRLNCGLFLLLLAVLQLGCIGRHGGGEGLPKRDASKWKTPSPVDEDVELLRLQSVLRPAFHARSLAEVQRALDHPFPEVRANAIYELVRRDNSESLERMFSLLGDESDVVAGNARWFFHYMYGLPMLAEPAWCREWIQHVLIDKREESAAYRIEGISQIEEDALSKLVQVNIACTEMYREFGGKVLFRVVIQNLSNSEIRLRVSFPGRYQATRFSESGEAFVEELGEDWRSALFWSVEKMGILDGRELVEETRYSELEDVSGVENIAPGSSAHFDLEVDVPDSVSHDGRTKQWNFCELRAAIVLEKMLLTVNEDRLYWCSLTSEAKAVQVYRTMHRLQELNNPALMRQSFARSDFSTIREMSDRLREIDAEYALLFVDMLFTNLNSDYHETWNRFLYRLIGRHSPISITDSVSDIESKKIQYVQAWWQREKGSLEWDADSGRFDRPLR